VLLRIQVPVSWAHDNNDKRISDSSTWSSRAPFTCFASSRHGYLRAWFGHFASLVQNPRGQSSSCMVRCFSYFLARSLQGLV
jgi:hypothetical protein